MSGFGFLGGSGVYKKKIFLPIQETWVRSLSQEHPLEKEMATHSRILGWRIPWIEEPGRLQVAKSQMGPSDPVSPLLCLPLPLVTTGLFATSVSLFLLFFCYVHAFVLYFRSHIGAVSCSPCPYFSKSTLFSDALC